MIWFDFCSFFSWERLLSWKLIRSGSVSKAEQKAKASIAMSVHYKLWRSVDNILFIHSFSLRNKEVLLEGSLLSGMAVPMHWVQGSGFWTLSGPLSICQDDINLIVTNFNVAFKVLLKRVTVSSIIFWYRTLVLFANLMVFNFHWKWTIVNNVHILLLVQLTMRGGGYLLPSVGW